MMVETTKFGMAEYLDSPEAIATYLQVVLDENDHAAFRKALGTVARAVGMSKLAEKASVARASLYKALSDTGNPSFETVARVLKPLGLRLSVAP
ncbi:MAG: putative addiction module antidote protein [Sphingomonas sp.]|nr:putative addiction module antidote protein [Sphingomonas sp.]